MKLQKRELILITALCDLLILLLGFRLVVSPIVGEYRANKDELARLSAFAAEANGLMTQDSGASAANVAELAEQTAGFFYPETAPENAHRYIAGLMEQSGLALGSIAISSDNSGVPAGFSRLAADVSVLGTQEQLLDFLKNIEAQKRAIAAESFTLTPVRGGREISAGFRIVLYCLSGSEVADIEYSPPKPKAADGFRFGAAQ